MAAVVGRGAGRGAKAIMADPSQRHVLSLLEMSGWPMARTKFQKVMYLLSVDHPKEGSDYDFKPYKYGPYCHALVKTCEKLERDDIIEIEDLGLRTNYHLTEKGKPIGEEAVRHEDERALGSFHDCLGLFDGMGHDDMLA